MAPRPFLALMAGAGVGLLGGLLGLGGAEFRLPLLVALFGYALRQAIPVKRAISLLAVVIAASVARGTSNVRLLVRPGSSVNRCAFALSSDLRGG